MTAAFKYLRGSCPVCHGARKDCRQSTKNDLIHCRDSEANPLDYVLIGEDSLGFGLWKYKADIESATQEKREEWRRRRELEQHQQQQRLKKLLSIEERDRQYRELNSSLSLSRKHRRQLEEVRGLMPAEIDFAYQQGWIRTWNRDQQTYGLSRNLAGVNPNDGRLLGVDALAIAATDGRGRITGFQLGADDREKFGKYIWTSSNKKGGNGPQLPNGELPLFVWRHPDANHISEIWICEGGLKSLLTAIALWFRYQRKDIAVIGAAGGNHASSSEAVKAALASLGANSLVLGPDAGAISNRNILSAYQKTKHLVGELSVAWWGQTEKSNPDIDEWLLAGEPLPDRISWEEFTSYWQAQPAAKQESDRRISREDWELNFGLIKFFKHQFSKISENLSQKFQQGNKQSEPKPNRLAVAPDKVVEPGTLVREIASAIKEGATAIQVHSDCGQGKSHELGEAKPEDFGASSLWYISSSPRNPTTQTVEENYVPLPVQNNGLKIDSSRKTPLGKNYIVWPQKGDKPDLPGNCHRTPLIHALAAKRVEGIQGQDNPICASCHLLNACRNSSGPGYGFKNERALGMKNARKSAHINSLPNPDEYDYSNDVAIIDEAVSLQLLETVQIKQKDIDQLIAHLATNHPSLYKVLHPLLSALRPYLTGELKQYHGFGDAALREALPLPEGDLDELIAAVEEAIAPNRSFLENDSIDIDTLPASDRKGMGRIKKLLEKETAIGNWEGTQQIDDLILLNWLPLLLEVLAGQQQGALQCSKNTLSITTKDERKLEILRAFKAVVVLDGTMPREELALKLQLQPQQIRLIEPPKPYYGNLILFQVTGLGHCGGKNPTDTMHQRKAALRKALEAKHPGIKFLDFKANIEDPNDGAWFVDSRGVNRIEGVPVRCTFGTPFENLGSLQAEYTTLSGKQAVLGDRNKGIETDPDLQAFIDARTQQHRIQDIGRQRSHRYPDQQFVYYAVTDDDLSFLKEELPGVTIEQMEAVEITPEAGTKGQQTIWAMIQAAKDLIERGQQVTQRSLAEATSYSLIYIKKIAAGIGGWRKFQQGIQTLLDAFNSECIPSTSLDDEELFFLNWLPALVADSKASTEGLVEAITNLGSIPKIIGFQRFKRVLGAAPLDIRAELLSMVRAILPPDLRQEIQEMAVGAIASA